MRNAATSLRRPFVERGTGEARLLNREDGVMPGKNFDDVDVKAALERTGTGDGPGTDNLDDLPESDFVAFAEGGVENDPEELK
ncbi:hypothetical protein KMT30_16490 [Streptomyces sp. IBSBF 2953]|nr:hypothetical protein [Streptomyces hayashii]